MWVIPNLDLANLNPWLVGLDEDPVVCRSFRATIGSIAQNELVLIVLNTVAWLQLIDSDKIVVIIEIFDGLLGYIQFRSF